MNKTIVNLVLAMIFLLTGCANKAQTGAGVGALGGALVGSLLFPGKNKEFGALIGATIGGSIGYMFGNEMDKNDLAQTGKTLEYNSSGQSTTWRNPDTGASYTATPGPVHYRNQTSCCPIQIEAWINGKKSIVNSTACRHNGNWVMQS